MDPVLERHALLQGLVALAPSMALYGFLGEPLLLPLNLLTISLLLGVSRCQRSLALLLVHAALLTLAITALFVAEDWTVSYVLLCALYGFGSVWVARLGGRWSTVGNFTLIPALYLAYELHRQNGALVALVPVLLVGIPLAVTSVLLATLLVGPRDWRWGWQRWPLGKGERERLSRQALIRAVAVFLTATAVRLLQPAFGPWLIWSSASVATGEVTSTRRKGWDRAVGATLGLGLAVLLVRWVPVSPALHALGVLLTVLTLVAFRSYRVAFGCRCCGIVLTAAAGGQAWSTVGLERLGFVLAGGAVGIALAVGLARMERQCS